MAMQERDFLVEESEELGIEIAIDETVQVEERPARKPKRDKKEVEAEAAEAAEEAPAAEAKEVAAE